MLGQQNKMGLFIRIDCVASSLVDLVRDDIKSRV